MKWDEWKRNGTNENEVKRKETKLVERKRNGMNGNDVGQKETMRDEGKRCGKKMKWDERNRIGMK